MDVDGILTDFHATVAHISTKAGFPITSKEMSEWEIGSALRNVGAPKEIVETCLKAISSEGFNTNLEPDKEAQIWLPEVKKIANVLFITSPNFECPTWIPERVKWMYKHFGIEKNEILLSIDKSWVPGDIFIDDCPKNVTRWSSKNHLGVALLWDKPYNQALDIRRVVGWEKLITIVKNYSFYQVLST